MNTYEMERGFTKVELIVGTIILFVYFGLAVPGFQANMDVEREAEVRSNLHIIQMAIERYEVDNKRYPSFLLGGDNKGWHDWHRRHDMLVPAKDAACNNRVVDPLIKYGYLQSYPKNPFVDNGMRIIKSTCALGSGQNFLHQYGDGDPRFGFYGNTMGNGLSDPSYYRHRLSGIPPVETPLVETSRTLDKETVKRLGFLEPPDGLHYMMGGRKAFDKEGNVITLASWWPGNFFYRGLFPHRIG